MGHNNSQRGILLMEMVVALSIMGLLATCAYNALRLGFDEFKETRGDRMLRLKTRWTLSKMKRDFRCAFLTPEEGVAPFVGHPSRNDAGDTVSFKRSAPLNTSNFLAKRVTYTLEPTTNHTFTLVREEASDNGIESRRILLSGVVNMKLRYFDGSKWHSSWGWDVIKNKPYHRIKGLPLLAEINLFIKGKRRELMEKAVTPLMVTLLNHEPQT